MFTFYFFVNFVVGMLGTAAFLALFLGSLLAGNFFGYYFHYKQDYYSAVGASGAVTGVLFSALLLYPNIELMLFLIPIPIPGYLFGIGYILYTLYGMKSQSDTIGHTAHFGGAIGGILITLIVMPEVMYSSILMLSIELCCSCRRGLTLQTTELVYKEPRSSSIFRSSIGPLRSRVIITPFSSRIKVAGIADT